MRTQIVKSYQYGQKAIRVCTFLILLFVIVFGGCSGGHVGIGVSSYNHSNKWHYKFHYLDGGVQGRLTAKNDEAQLIRSSSIEDGTVDFQLYNSKNSLLVSFSANNTTDTIKGIVL